jgi:hypothetical protein
MMHPPEILLTSVTVTGDGAANPSSSWSILPNSLVLSLQETRMAAKRIDNIIDNLIFISLVLKLITNRYFGQD